MLFYVCSAVAASHHRLSSYLWFYTRYDMYQNPTQYDCILAVETLSDQIQSTKYK